MRVHVCTCVRVVCVWVCVRGACFIRAIYVFSVHVSCSCVCVCVCVRGGFVSVSRAAVSLAFCLWSVRFTYKLYITTHITIILLTSYCFDP